MRLFFDVTKSHRARHASGLVRVGASLRRGLASAPGLDLSPVTWNGKSRAYTVAGARAAAHPAAGDALLVQELFSEEERPGFAAYLSRSPALRAAVFHDAIPLRHPEVCWPQAVARHPSYMKALAGFDVVLAVSHASREDLLGYWRWLGVDRAPPVEVLTHGADFVAGRPPPGAAAPPGPATVLCVGILEPRKNQALLLDACERLWAGGADFRLLLAGRENPHHGKDIVKRVRGLRRRGLPVEHHPGPSDEALQGLYRAAALSVFPSRFEGFGLPVLESLWMRVPCLCSDIPVLREISAGGGCAEFRSADPGSLARELGALVADAGGALARLRGEIDARELPTWEDAGRRVLDVLAGARRPAAEDRRFSTAG